jgi:hypothetical protein
MYLIQALLKTTSYTCLSRFTAEADKHMTTHVAKVDTMLSPRHVASTFKCLATTTTHCDLINFYQNRQGKPPSHDIAHDPVRYPYSDCKMVNMQLLYRASDRKSLDFCRSY